MRWAIEDFKGLRTGEVDLEPGKLSVLTGVNSSGKSSALQSILMMTQSLYHEGGIVLNGPLVRLGAANDLVREGASPNQIRLCFEMTEADNDDEPTSLEPVSVAANLSPSGDKSTLCVTRLELHQIGAPESRSAIFDKARPRRADLQTVVNATEAAADEEFLHLKSSLGLDRKPLRTYVRMEGLEPVEIIQVSDTDLIARQYRREISHFLTEQDGSNKRKRKDSLSDDDEFSTFIIVHEFMRLISHILESERPNVNPAVRELIDSSRGFNPRDFLRRWKAISEDVKQDALDYAVESRSQKPYIKLPIGSEYSQRVRRYWLGNGLLERRFRRNISFTFSALNMLCDNLQSISSRVQYLGPLRDEPRVVWNQWNELARGLPVGTRGEYSAVRLSQSAKRSVSYVRPNGDAATGTLGTAVNEWLGYLEIGEEVSATDVGKLGVRLELKLSGRSRDLTAVGVGVSQALPLVVAVLLVPQNSVFIVEQPELHLHPAVQARLADFLLHARPDLACVVETHSDAFVTRIRRRVAEGAISPDRVDIIFVEVGKGGSTTHALSVSEFGDLSDWPVGFISGEDEDARAILRANMQRIGNANGTA